MNLLRSLTPLFDDFRHLFKQVYDDEPTIEDYILLVGTLVALVAFILWCCFPIVPGNPSEPGTRQYETKQCQHKCNNNQRKVEVCSTHYTKIEKYN